MVLARKQRCGKAERNADTYSRQLLIPGWNQQKVSNTSVGKAGAGGLGACVTQAAVAQGLGEDSVFVTVDPDLMEDSNRSRITYATEQDVRKRNPKVYVEKRYVKTVRPHRKVISICQPCHSVEAQRALSGCDVLIGCVDNELGRYTMNFLAASFLIPLLDLGAGVSIEEINGEKVAVSGGQARLFIPGTTPCLLCNLGLDFEDFDRELLKLKMDNEERELLGKTGYLKNFVGDDVPEPNVYTVNAVVANLGIDILIRYLIGGGIGCHALHYSAEAGVLEKIWSESMNVCPVCGPNGVIGKGEFFDLDGLLADKKFPEPKNYSDSKRKV